MPIDTPTSKAGRDRLVYVAHHPEHEGKFIVIFNKHGNRYVITHEEALDLGEELQRLYLVNPDLANRLELLKRQVEGFLGAFTLNSLSHAQRVAWQDLNGFVAKLNEPQPLRATVLNLACEGPDGYAQRSDALNKACGCATAVDYEPDLLAGSVKSRHLEGPTQWIDLSSVALENPAVRRRLIEQGWTPPNGMDAAEAKAQKVAAEERYRKEKAREAGLPTTQRTPDGQVWS
jgi:hypothetical protein